MPDPRSGSRSTSAARSSTRWSSTAAPTQVRFRKASTTPAGRGRACSTPSLRSAPICREVELFIHGTTLGPQRGAGAARRRDRHHHQRGLPRHLPDRPGQRPGRPHVRLPATSGRQALVERRHTAGVRGRLDHRGRVVEALDADGVRPRPRHLVERTACARSPSASCTPTATRATSGGPPRSSASAHPDVTVSISTDIVARVPRVRAHQHHRARRLHPPDLRALRRPARAGAGRTADSPGGS